MGFEPLSISGNANIYVFSFDEAYARYFSVALISLAAHVPQDTACEIVILHHDVTDETIERLNGIAPDNFTLQFVDVSDCLDELFGDVTSKTVEDKWTVPVFFDLLVPFVFPQCERVLFCDSDIVFADDPSELFAMPFDGKPLSAVRDTLAMAHVFAPDSEFVKRQIEFVHTTIGLQDLGLYFNGGILLFNIPAIDKDRYRMRVQQALQFPELPTVDQDVLNYAFCGNAKIIPQRFNLQAHLTDTPYDEDPPEPAITEYFEAAQTPVIVHYTTHVKPWSHDDCPMGALFWDYAKRSPWYEELQRAQREKVRRAKLERFTPRRIARRIKKALKRLR